MAYRFLLEVPEILAEEASVAIEQVGDAQVVVVRPSHGLGVDDPYVDITVAAHSLRVIDSLYDWYESLSARPTLRIVLHGGERHALDEIPRARVVALIRSDQPWVERSIPHVGDHEAPAPAGYSVGPGVPPSGVVPDDFARSAVAVAELSPELGELLAKGEPAHRLQISAINYVLVQVNDLHKAELFYQEFFAMELLGRVRRDADGTMLPMRRDFSWERALQTGDLPEISFLANGPLVLAARRVGLGVVVNQGPLEMISVGVDARTFASLKGEVLMRPLTVLRSGVASFVFRDPLNVSWEIAVVGSVPLVPV